MQASIRRRPWLAGLLTFLVPGLGQLYNGRLMRAVALHIGSWLVSAAAFLVMLQWDAAPWNIAVGLLLPVAWFAGIVVGAIRDARRNRQTPAFGRWYVHLAIVFLGILLVAPVVIGAMRTSLCHTFQVPTGGMADTIMVGDFILVDKAAFGFHSPWTIAAPSQPPRRDQIVIFRRPSGSPHFGVQRIVGLRGKRFRFETSGCSSTVGPLSNPSPSTWIPRPFGSRTPGGPQEQSNATTSAPNAFLPANTSPSATIGTTPLTAGFRARFRPWTSSESRVESTGLVTARPRESGGKRIGKSIS